MIGKMDLSAPIVIALDDEPSMGQFLREVGEMVGCEVHTATTAKEFWALLKEHKADAISLDLVMPRVDGVEIIRQLADQHAGAQLILMSGFESKYLDMASSMATGKGLTVLGTLRKPVVLAELQALFSSLGNGKTTAAP